MNEERMMELLVELHREMPQQGPGDDPTTRRALSLLPPLQADARILDLGCGSGRSTFVLAQKTPARITAVDLHPLFVQRVQRQAEQMGLEQRVQAMTGDMAALDLPAGSFDLIWSEGAIYIMGFARGLRAWRTLLRPGGYLAVTEMTYLVDDPPRECRDYWAKEYAAITTVEGNLATIEQCGYRPLACFVVPESAWWRGYYEPLSATIDRLWPLHRDDPDWRALLSSSRDEMEFFRRHAASCGYVFFVMQREERDG